MSDIGLARLRVSYDLLASLLYFPDGVSIKAIYDSEFNDEFSIIISGEGLPTLDETNGEIKQAYLSASMESIPLVVKSEMRVDDNVVLRWERKS